MDSSSNVPVVIAKSIGEPFDHLSVALECAHDGIVIADSNAVMVYANHSYEIISGFDRNKMIGRNMKDLIAQGFISVSGTLHVLETGQPYSTTQVFKTRRRALIASTPVFDESGAISMVVTNLRDMTDIYEIKGELRRREIQSQHYYEKLQSLRREISGDVDIIATDKAFTSTLRIASQIAEINDPVLLIGESGTGKKKLAKFIHHRSGRSQMPFVRITLPSDNPESQLAYLFGTEQSDESPSLGVLNVADRGTAYFDDITVLTPVVQEKLNEILSSGTYTLNGVVHSLDIRIIAASRSPLRELQRFIPPQSDLYRALSLFPLHVLPLRKRPDDIIPLLDYFLHQYNQKTGHSKTFSSGLYQELLKYSWPGNVTELQNFVKRAAVISPEDVIDESALGILEGSGELNPSAIPYGIPSPSLSNKICLKAELEKIEAQMMTQAFELYHNTRSAAESLGMGPSTFIRKRQQYEKAGLMQRQ